MPFLRQTDTIAIGSVGGENALRLSFPGAPYHLTFIEAEEGCQLQASMMADLYAVSTTVFNLEADQLNALGRFCVRQFMGEAPQEYLQRIKEATEFTLAQLEAWNDRAKADEEHPPYVDITNRLRQIEHSLEQLGRGLHE